MEIDTQEKIIRLQRVRKYCGLTCTQEAELLKLKRSLNE